MRYPDAHGTESAFKIMESNKLGIMKTGALEIVIAHNYLLLN